ncbi:phosphotransferase [Aerococcus sanguinicola]|uniref:phosphotransferase family protein n=1 Tax=unclassified Aerococcus TaxID=2618060 RepID=UPI0008A34FC2|nr:MULTISPECIES: phosphotransferase family protein [unclassified Aerococcus]KAB0645912.1 phosphotransferase family protein [Aerococcus sanguinicola]MDK6234185.1 phosphotransferase family protein [Aerococcus sp. UMB10185]MDK6805051.1 phosphotransferase family protein [Aerococcus sp. UMB7834]MDK6856223.1 phosphotransferase family protein [Aerococcus sp. UMB7533]MDK8503003.1 phosphotransferase family protein [Aerococcus sp. UMB1112A]
MEYQFDKEWTLHPIGGDTGQAFMGTHKQERVFLKRNSSPFLAALSMEGITPRLIWSKRTSTGDTFSAQEWLRGHTLTEQEMHQSQVIKLIHRYQHSDHLYKMLVKIGGQEWGCSDFIADYEDQLHHHLASHSLLNEVLTYLEETAPFIKQSLKTVCHGDLNRKNFLLSEQNRLYLVDWESVRIADPISDLTQVLVQYIPSEDWESWWERYGLQVDESSYLRIEWFALINLLLLIKESYRKDRQVDVNEAILKLRHIYDNRYFQDQY